MNLHLRFDQHAAPELAHYGAALREYMMGRGWSVTASYSPDWNLASLPATQEAPAQSSVVAFGESDGSADLRVSLRSTQLEIESRRGRFTVPLAVSPSTFPQIRTTVSEMPRVLFYGETSPGRRSRMTTKVIVEMRRRRFSFSAIAYGAAEEGVRGMTPDELHELLGPSEFAALFTSANCVLEASDQIDALSGAFVVAADLGIPTVCHRDVSALSPSSIQVDEWSADAFAEAIMTLDSRAQVKRDQRRLSESLAEFEKVLRDSAQ